MRDLAHTTPTIWPGQIAKTIRCDEQGFVLGADTPLVRSVATGRFAVEEDGERFLALLSVLCRRPVSSEMLRPIEAAALHWASGDRALANLRLIFSGLPKLDAPADADRLLAAAYCLDHGMTPRGLMTALDLDPSVLDLVKFDPNQSRVPAGNGRESGRWRRVWDDVVGWLEEPVPEYDTDTGMEVGTRSRARAIATNPVTVGIAGTAALLGGEAAIAVEAPMTIQAAEQTLPKGMNRVTFGELAGFVKGPTRSSQASTEATVEILDNLKSAGVTRKSISAFQRFYAGVASGPIKNPAAIHRAQLLYSILRKYK